MFVGHVKRAIGHARLLGEQRQALTPESFWGMRTKACDLEQPFQTLL